jgi:hypothetical protein
MLRQGKKNGVCLKMKKQWGFSSKNERKELCVTKRWKKLLGCLGKDERKELHTVVMKDIQ